MSDTATSVDLATEMLEENYKKLDDLLELSEARQQAQLKKALAVLQSESEEWVEFPTIRAQDLEKGMTIVEGRTRTKITEIEHRACSTRGTHVNGKWCYGNPQVPVQIAR